MFGSIPPTQRAPYHQYSALHTTNTAQEPQASAHTRQTAWQLGAARRHIASAPLCTRRPGPCRAYFGRCCCHRRLRLCAKAHARSQCTSQAAGDCKSHAITNQNKSLSLECPNSRSTAHETAYVARERHAVFVFVYICICGECARAPEPLPGIPPPCSGRTAETHGHHNSAPCGCI